MDSLLRPRDLALLLLASGDLLPRKRARDQQADRAGLELKRILLDRLAALDPEPTELEAALVRIVEEMGPPTGPTRTIAAVVREEWQTACASPEWVAPLLVKPCGKARERNPVAGEFIRKWFGKAAAVSPEVKEALAELGRLAESRPALAGPVRLLTDLLPKLYAQPIREVPPPLSREQASVKLAAGVPLLRGEPLTLDGDALRRRCLFVATAVASQRSDDAGRRLAEALRAGRLDPGEMGHAVLSGRPEEVFARADALQLDAALAGTVLRLALFPVLSHLGALLAPLWAGVSWEHGYCPVCGGWPLLGEHRGLEQIRFLRCELCAASWDFPRLACPFCDAHDHRLLGYLHVEGEDSGPRTATCDGCRGHVKMLTTLTELPGPRLLVADLATVYLDLAAAERGYSRPPLLT